MQINLEKRRTTPLQYLLSDLITLFESTAALNETVAPRCPCCGEIENLRSGWSGGNLIWLCPDAAREMEYER